MEAPQCFAPDFSGEVEKIAYLCHVAYEGSIKNGQRHGSGILTFRTGLKYLGAFDQGQCHGKGALVFPNGNIYEGEFGNNILLPDIEGTFYYREEDDSRTAITGKPAWFMRELLTKSAESMSWPIRVFTPPSKSKHLSAEAYLAQIADGELEKDAQSNDAEPAEPEKKKSTCWGCRENQPNQLAHVDAGGCLYEDFCADYDYDANYDAWSKAYQANFN